MAGICGSRGLFPRGPAMLPFGNMRSARSGPRWVHVVVVPMLNAMLPFGNMALPLGNMREGAAGGRPGALAMGGSRAVTSSAAVAAALGRRGRGGPGWPARG